ncbi:hypothetical protein CFP56_016949 [Quercus suber]|uniref:Uncharacterized protein n=1 Tax=Quercus suber TaxID=58331 RepID=A0AAW0KNL3_QUESU
MATVLSENSKIPQRCLVLLVRSRCAIRTYLRELEEPHMKRKVLRLSHSPNTIKDVNAQLVTTTSGKLAEDLLKLVEQLKQWWKIKSSHGDVGFKALQVVWPQSLEKVKLVVPSQSTQHASWSLIQGMKILPLTHSYGSIRALTKSINKSERGQDLVIASYMLGEIPSLKDRITIVCQLWDLSRDVLVSVEPGTPHDLKPYLRCDVTYYGWRKGVSYS